MKTIETSKWNAWIDIQPIQPTQYGTLHVAGEIFTHPSQSAILVKAVPQGTNPKILLLNIIMVRSAVPTRQPLFLSYSESLLDASQYSSIDVLYTGKIIASITDIPIIS